MANRMYQPGAGFLEVGVVTLYAKATIGGAGAITMVSANSKGIFSIVRNSAGQYKVTLSDSYPTLLFASCQLLDTADSDPSSIGVLNRVKSEAVSNATPTVTFQFYASDDGAVADPASGAALLFRIDLRNSSVTG